MNLYSYIIFPHIEYYHDNLDDHLAAQLSLLVNIIISMDLIVTFKV